jgi:membrane-associated protein
MHYPSFLAYSQLGTLLWVGGLLTLGYRFGNVPFIRQHLTVMILVVIALSLLPMLVGWLRHRLAQGGAVR